MLMPGFSKPDGQHLIASRVIIAAATSETRPLKAPALIPNNLNKSLNNNVLACLSRLDELGEYHENLNMRKAWAKTANYYICKILMDFILHLASSSRLPRQIPTMVCKTRHMVNPQAKTSDHLSPSIVSDEIKTISY